MNLKGFDGVYNTKSQMDCFAEKMLGIKNTIPADIEDGYYLQGIIEAMMNSTQSRTWHIQNVLEIVLLKKCSLYPNLWESNIWRSEPETGLNQLIWI